MHDRIKAVTSKELPKITFVQQVTLNKFPPFDWLPCTRWKGCQKQSPYDCELPAFWPYATRYIRRRRR